jgi:magnesium transporter
MNDGDDERGGAVDPFSSTTVRILERQVVGLTGSRELAEEDIATALADGEVLWIDLTNPGLEATSLLKDSLQLESLTVEDCLLPVRMPKLDSLPDGGAFVAAFSVQLDRGDEPRLRAISVPLVIGPTFLVTVRREPRPEERTQIEAAMNSQGELLEHSGIGLAHAALDVLIDGHLPVMLQTAEVAEDLEDDLDPQRRSESLLALERLIVLRRDLLAFRRLGVAQQEVLGRLGRMYPSVRTYLADVADNQREAVETAEATCDYIDGAVEAFRVRRDVRTEDGIRRLTVLAAIVGPMSVIIGLWGLNFRIIPGTDERWGWPVFVGAQLGFAAVAAWYFHRRGML